VIPIHSLLADVRDDPELGRGHWEISYFDRAGPDLVRVSLTQVRTQHHIGFVFDVVDDEGITRGIPHNRVRQVWRDGKLAWSRLAPRKTRKAPQRPKRPLRKRVVPRSIRR
jgi:hypothetical protein